MKIDRLVDYAQEHFLPLSTDLSGPTPGRPPLPEWVPGADSELTEDFTSEIPIFDVEPDLVDTLGAYPQLAGSPHGPDALAYYIPYHFPSIPWGIYVLERGLAVLAWSLKKRQAGLCDIGLLSLAWKVLLEHERFHFMTEVALTRAELTVRSRVYPPYFGLEKSGLTEEAMANAFALRRLNRRYKGTLVIPAVTDWMTTQGKGYCDFASKLSGRDFAEGKVSLAESGLSHLHVAYSASDPGPLGYLFEKTEGLRVPIRLVRSGPRIVGHARRFPKAYGLRVEVHTNDHPPPHIHVTVLDTHEVTRYSWPELEPLPGDNPLGSGATKKLGSYVQEYGTKIDQKLAKVYPPAGF